MGGDLAAAKQASPGLLHYAREAAVVLLVVVLLRMVARHKRAQVGRVTVNPWIAIVVVYVAFLSGRTVLLGYPLINIGYGMRPVLLVLIVAAMRHLSREDADELLQFIARGVKPLVAALVAIAGYQVVSSPAFFGETAFGARPWGTLASPNNLAVAALGFAVLFVLARPRRWGWWFAACVAIVAVSGARTALIGIGVLLAVLMFRNLRGAGLLLIPTAGAGVFLLDLLSSQAVTGRRIDVSEEGRFVSWSAKLGELSFDELLIGRAFGAGANAAQVGATTAGGASDSQFVTQILSTGVIGLVILAVGLLHLWLSMDKARWLVFPAILLTAAVYNVAEYYPTNLILAFVAGAVASRCECSPLTSFDVRKLLVRGAVER